MAIAYFKSPAQFADETTTLPSLSGFVSQTIQPTTRKRQPSSPWRYCFLREFKNTEILPKLDNVDLRDQLPNGVVSDQCRLSANHTTGALLENGDNLVSGGVNGGSYARAAMRVRFKAKVADNVFLRSGGVNTRQTKRCDARRPELERRCSRHHCHTHLCPGQINVCGRYPQDVTINE